MSMRMTAFLLLAALGLTPVFAADPSPGVRCDGIYCRETEDRDWHVRISGEVISPAGVYVAIQGIAGNVVFRGKIPSGKYPPESPYEVKVPKDGIVGDYLLTVFGTQSDFGSIRTPFTDLPFEVYGKTFFHITQNGSGVKPYTVVAPGGLFFQVAPGAEDLTISQGKTAWRIHALDGSVVFNVSKQGKGEVNPDNNRTTWVGTFKGKSGTTYILGHELYWCNASPRLYVAVSPERWFEPDPRLHLDPAWWRQEGGQLKEGTRNP